MIRIRQILTVMIMLSLSVGVAMSNPLNKEPIITVKKSDGWVQLPTSAQGKMCFLVEYGKDAKFTFSEAKPADNVVGVAIDKEDDFHCVNFDTNVWISTKNTDAKVQAFIEG